MKYSPFYNQNVEVFPSVGVIILNYNNPDYTVDCVKSFLQKVDYPNYHILVVDCGSSDDSLKRFKTELEEIDLLPLYKNKGYTGGNNEGANYFLNLKYDYIHIINNDTLVYDGNYLTNLVAFMKTHPQYGVIGPTKIRSADGTFQPTSTWVPSFKNRALFHLGYSLPLVIPIGVCLLIRHEVIREVGLFNETYFMYGEEQDFCDRVLSAGWKTGSVETESLIHFGGNLLRWKPLSWPLQQARRNSLLFLKDRGHYIQALILQIAYILVTSLEFVITLFKSNTNLSAYVQTMSAICTWWRLKPKIGPSL